MARVTKKTTKKDKKEENKEEKKPVEGWYVVRVVAGQENAVKKAIESEARAEKLEDRIFQVLIPVEKVFEIRDGKKKLRERILYPGYVFCHLFPDGEVISTINNIPNVIGFLHSKAPKRSGNEMPEPLRKSEVEKMLGRMNASHQDEEVVEIPFVEGEEVKVIDGPFDGCTGVVKRIHKDKIEVEVKIFERSTPVELSYTQIEKVF
ncbi:MAG: transcription termination/antitermination protein NusG [Bacteroidia bacterium]|nr:transcription termination/antitermination protein NusG [Bacteroidia bacterium]MDW8302122.1 transcription termination/antitermination protein NusG [Bacteroidia bacterium]